MTVSSPSADGSPGPSGAGAAAASLPGPSDRARPNILVTGTPGTGKTTTASLIAEEAGMTHVDVSALVKKEVSLFFALSPSMRRPRQKKKGARRARRSAVAANANECT
jgi:DNA replication protein DnaC